MTGDNGVSPKDSPSNIELEEMLDGLLNAANDEENAGGMTFAERSAAGMGTNGESQKQEAAEDDEPDQPKVELDLDDAPFLEEEEIIKPPIQEAHTRAALAANEENDQDEDPGGLRGFLLRLRKNKKRLAMASALAIFILAAPLVFLLLSGDKEAALPEQPNQAQAPQPPPTTPPAVLDNRFVYQSSAYLVPLQGSEGELRFLRVRYTLVTESLQIFAELQQKSIPIRDAVYHYLSKKPLTLLSGEEQAGLLRSDLINVINQQLSADKITELNFEEYLITGS